MLVTNFGVHLTVILMFCFNIKQMTVHCALYPYESESRETKSLNGLWKFKIVKDVTAFDFIPCISEEDDIIKMPVPASFNDITTNATIRDHIGWVVYETQFYVPRHWKGDETRVFVHFGGVHYYSVVFLNGDMVGYNVGGHMPFQVELTEAIIVGLNVLTVNVNNTLTNHSLPQGFTKQETPDWYPEGFTTYRHNCDYFDYAGINRPVTLFTTPKTYICNIAVDTYTNDNYNIGYIDYAINNCATVESNCVVKLIDKSKAVVSSMDSCNGTLMINNVKLWWPIMSKHLPGYLYTLEVSLKTASTADVYRLPVGVRSVSWTPSSILINNEPVYLKGVGMHEDSNIRGRGFDNVVMSRDMNLFRWLGANSYRTSHYPYAEETLNEADALGILVILETPGCSIDNFGKEMRNEHERVLKEIINQHRNRPSVIIWSLANEPLTNLNESAGYFRYLADMTRQLDRTRPVTFVTSQHPENDVSVKFMDVICVNRYNGWYQLEGRLELVKYSIKGEIMQWRNNFSKPVIIAEYGAGSLSGYHNLPATMWTEDYQVSIYKEHFKAFDELRSTNSLIGEMIWNFADFNVPQEYNRPGKCAKGLFTRERQPKSAAHMVRRRYHSLMEDPTTNYKADFMPQVDLV